MDAADLLAFKTIPDVDMSPDGGRVAYVVMWIDTEKDEYRSTIHVAPIEGGAPVEFTRGPTRDSAPRWSPDGTQLAFLSDRAGAERQLYVMSVRGGEPRQLTSLSAHVGTASWSPDGTKIAFSSRAWVEPRPKDAAARERWEQRPRHVTKAQYKTDGQGYTFDARAHLFIVDVATGETKRLTDGDFEDRAESWSPDGRQIAFSRTRGGKSEYSVSDIWVADVATGAALRITEDVGRAISPTWSPDGTTIACYGTDSQDPGLGDPMMRVWTVSSQGGEPRRLTERYDRGAVLLPTPTITPGPIWSPDNASVTFIAGDHGNMHLVRATTADGSTNVVVGGERQIAFASAKAGSRIAFAAGDLAAPSDLYVTAWDGSGERRLTQLNKEILAQLAPVHGERRTFTSPHGGTLEGWLFLPGERRGASPLCRYPRRAGELLGQPLFALLFLSLRSRVARLGSPHTQSHRIRVIRPHLRTRHTREVGRARPRRAAGGGGPAHRGRRRGSRPARDCRVLVWRIHDELDDRSHRSVQGGRGRRAGGESGIVFRHERYRHVVRSVGMGRASLRVAKRSAGSPQSTTSIR
jgi:Tol biopolymer transport system component